MHGRGGELFHHWKSETHKGKKIKGVGRGDWK